MGITGAAGREARGALDRSDHGAGTTASAISHAAAGGGAAATEAGNTSTTASGNSVQEAKAGDDAECTRAPQDPPPYDHEWPNPENGWVMDGVSYKPAWERSRSTSREEKPAASRPRWTRSRSTSKDVGEARKPEEGKPAMPVAPLLQQKPKSRPEVKEMPNETGRATDLPELVGDGSPLTFGDWMATIDHYMKDISTYSAMWWEEVCASAKEAEWLVASPLQRLRIKPELGS